MCFSLASQESLKSDPLSAIQSGPLTGFPDTLDIRETLENEFPIFQSGKNEGIWEKHKQNQGETQKICDSDPRRERFPPVWGM